MRLVNFMRTFAVLLTFNSLEFMCAVPGQDSYISTVREYEGPFGDWHQERLCAPKGFLKMGQQNFQSYQGIFTGLQL